LWEKASVRSQVGHMNVSENEPLMRHRKVEISSKCECLDLLTDEDG
jgi:hypothetical protein